MTRQILLMLLTASNSFDLAERIHREVNTNTQYRPDTKDTWQIAGKYGDCEDYALAKRERLLAAGWPVDKQSLCICRTESGESHCVLYVETDKGGFILDNRHDAPIRPKELPYKWEGMLCDGGWRQVYAWL